MAFALPENRVPLTHEVTMHERDEFQPRASLRVGAPSCDAVQLRYAEERVRVELIRRLGACPADTAALQPYASPEASGCAGRSTTASPVTAPETGSTAWTR